MPVSPEPPKPVEQDAGHRGADRAERERRDDDAAGPDQRELGRARVRAGEVHAAPGDRPAQDDPGDDRDHQPEDDERRHGDADRLRDDGREARQPLRRGPGDAAARHDVDGAEEHEAHPEGHDDRLDAEVVDDEPAQPAHDDRCGDDDGERRDEAPAVLPHEDRGRDVPEADEPGTERSMSPRRTSIVCPSAASPRNEASSSIDLMLVAELNRPA